jgi:hypothetical protein
MPRYKLLNGIKVQFTAEEEAQRDIEEAQALEEKAEYDANEYQRERATAYPSIQEQLDMQYWDKVNGTTNWEDAIAKVKSDIPKA